MNGKKYCFVVMGFGKKTDPYTGRNINLDETYEKVIQPLFYEEFPNFELIRADELVGSNVIDKNMYNLLLKAELVIADITTDNANALYELGVRHALRPFSTIIMCQKREREFGFDLNHTRILTYNNFGEKLESDESFPIRNKLKKYVEEALLNKPEEEKIDSPFYTYLPKVTPPSYDQEYQYNAVKATKNTKIIGNLIKSAKQAMLDNDFKQAKKYWKQLSQKSPDEIYFVQQLALATYKSKEPTQTDALMEALEIINKLPLDKTLEVESLSIAAAIYKNLYRVNKNPDYLRRAITFSKKAYIVTNDYYPGENYINCLLLEAFNYSKDEEKVCYAKLEAQKTYKELLKIIKNNDDEDDYWKYATQAVAYKFFNKESDYLTSKSTFESKCQSDWEKLTFNNTISELEEIKRVLFSNN